jgi:hypothetical protein
MGRFAMIKLMPHKGDLLLEFPPHWNLSQTLFKAKCLVEIYIRDMVADALSNPKGSPTLEKLQKHEPLIEGGPMDFNMALILILSVAQRFDVGLVGHQVLHPAAEIMDFNYFADMETAIKKGCVSARRLRRV